MDETKPATAWSERERYWQKKLGRIRLGVEPVEAQLERMRRVNLTMISVCGGIALIFAGIFAAFRHPGLGLAAIAILMLPAALSWDRFQRLSRNVASYLRERDEAQRAAAKSAETRAG